jgi:hypothetical protein
MLRVLVAEVQRKYYINFSTTRRIYYVMEMCAVEQLVEALLYKPAGSMPDSRWIH